MNTALPYTIPAPPQMSRCGVMLLSAQPHAFMQPSEAVWRSHQYPWCHAVMQLMQPPVAVWSLALACIDRWREHVASCHSLTLTRGTAGPRQLQTGGIINLSGCIESEQLYGGQRSQFLVALARKIALQRQLLKLALKCYGKISTLALKENQHFETSSILSEMMQKGFEFNLE